MVHTAPPSPYRPVSTLDLAAACASLVLPKAWHPRLDQTRLDLKSVVDSFYGRHEAPFRDSRTGPRPSVPLDTIDPIAHVLPKSIARRYVATRRDLQFLTLSLRGQHPPPFTSRHDPLPASGEVPRKRIETRALRVTKVTRPVDDAVTVELEGPVGTIESFEPGQFLTLTVEVEGVRYQRAYSICSPTSWLPRLAITVKRVPGGVVSNFLNDHVREGDLLRVRGPAGTFTLPPHEAEPGRVVLLAAGAGITPMMPVIHALMHDTNACVDLVYGNRFENGILFREDLDAYARAFPGRFAVHHVLSRPGDGWEGRRGRVDRAGAAAVLDRLENLDADTRYLLCGPEAMMNEVRDVLSARGVPSERVLMERFVSPRADAAAQRPTEPQPATFHVGGEVRDVVVPGGTSLLQAGLDAGLPLSYSCAMGGCAACRVKLRRGKVQMDEPNALTTRERDEGYVLACIAHPTEAVEVESA